MRMMFTVHQELFLFHKKNTFASLFTNGVNRPGVNHPVLKITLERTVPGGTGFGASRPITLPIHLHTYSFVHMVQSTF